MFKLALYYLGRGPSEIAEVHRRLAEIIPEEIDRQLAEMAEQAAARARLYAPVKTGALRNSIGWRRIDFCVYELYVEVDYAAYVEFGTRRKGPRPFFRPAIKEIADKKIVNRQIADAVTARLSEELAE